MNKVNKNFLILKIVSIILGSIIGAGFATGQELYSFFGRYGLYGILGILISACLITYVLYIVLVCIKRQKINNYEEYINLIFNNNKILTYINKNIISIFLLLSFFVMELGFASLLLQQYSIPKYIGIVGISLLSYLVFMGNEKSLEKVNVILMPILIITILFMTITGIIKYENQIVLEINTSLLKAVISGIVYASYNLILLIPLIISLEQKELHENESKKVSICVLFIFLVLSLCVLSLLSAFDISNIEIPIIHIANYIGNVEVQLSAIIILLAIFTSVVCIGFSFLNNVSKSEKAYKRNSIIISVLGIIMMNFNFANTMRVIYSFLGILGIIQIFAILLANFKKN